MTDPTQKMVEIANDRERIRRELEQKQREALEPKKCPVYKEECVAGCGENGSQVCRRVRQEVEARELQGPFESEDVEGYVGRPVLCETDSCEKPCPCETETQKAIRTFGTGATRNNDSDALDYEGFWSPLVMQAFAEYMHEHRFQADGQVRASDNWQKGIPLDSYMKSGFRHFMDWWLEHRGHESREGLIKGLCGLLFNVQGYLHELLKSSQT